MQEFIEENPVLVLAIAGVSIVFVGIIIFWSMSEESSPKPQPQKPLFVEQGESSSVQGLVIEPYNQGLWESRDSATQNRHPIESPGSYQALKDLNETVQDASIAGENL